MAQQQQFLNRLAGKTLVIHGKFGRGEEEMITEMAKAHQGKVVDDLGPAVDYLVLPEVASNQTLQKKVLSLNGKGASIQVIDAAALKKMMELTDQEVMGLIRAGGKEAATVLGMAIGRPYLHHWSPNFPSATHTFAGEQFSGCDLTDFTFTGIDFEACDFAGATLTGAKVEAARRCDFSRINGEKCAFDGIEGSKFADAKVSSASINGNISDVDFSGAVLDSASFRPHTWRSRGKSSISTGVRFTRAQLRQAQFRESGFKGATFDQADLTDAVFAGATFDATTFRKATLRNAMMVGCHLAAADFTDADLQGANLADTDLTGACFDGANLEGCNLGRATLNGASLAKARNYNPIATAARKIGPALQELDTLAAQAKRIRFSFRVIMTQDAEGEEASIDTTGLKYGWGMHPPGGIGRFSSRTRNPNQTVSDAMLELVSLVGNKKVRFETVDAETTKSPKAAREICALVVKGIAEAFGIEPPPAEELAAATRAYRATVSEAGAAQREEREQRKAAAEKEKSREVKTIEKTIQKQVGKVADVPTFLKALALRIEEAKIDKATKMLKKEGFQLYNDVTDTFMSGVVKSQTDADLVYACRIGSDGKYACCTQNLNICGGLRGSICKHLLVLIIGLVKAEKLDPTTIDGWVAKSNQMKAELDKEVMGEIFIKV